MKKSILKITALALGASLLFASCRRDKNDPVDDLTSITHASDEAAVNEESDQLTDDAGIAFQTAESSSSARVGKLYRLCGADSVIVSEDLKSAKIYYNNALSCDGKRRRTGVVNVTLSADKKWRDKDAVLTITTDGISITRLRDLKSITIKGTHIVKNVNGGLVSDLATSNTIIKHEITARAMSVTIERNGSARTWDAHRFRTISKNSTGIEVKIEGADAGGVAARGINRNGDEFSTTIVEPLIANSCNGISTDAKWNVLSGIKSHNVKSRTITVTYGYDSANNKVNTCEANTLKINYEGPKGSLERFYTYK